jgi:hypothetical protein
VSDPGDSVTAEPPGPGPTAKYEVVSGLAAYTECALKVVAEARMELALFTHTMDRRIYGSDAFVHAVRVFALQHRRARARIIVHSPAIAMRGAHRLVELGRVIASRIEFRQLPEERREMAQEYLVADERSFIHKPSHDALEAKYYAYAPLDARFQLREFNPLWEEATPAREFTDLRI